MADLPSYPAAHGNTGADTRSRPDADRPPATPRWVKVFGIIAIVLILLVVIANFTGLGGQHGPGRHLQSGAASSPPPPANGQENTGGVSGPADADEATRTVEITTLDNLTFEPSRINVSAGEAVTFVVTNRGQAVHQFTLGDAALQQERADEMAQMADGMTPDGPNSITLQPGETRQLTWRFGDTGTLEYGCHVQGNYQAGMRGQITIVATEVPQS